MSEGIVEETVVRNLWDDFFLKQGGGTLDDRGVCVMQAVSYISGEGDEHAASDHPRCTDNAITELFISLNDSFSDDQRQQLRPFIPRLVGTRFHELMSPAEKNMFDYSKVNLGKLMYERLSETIEGKIAELESDGAFYTGLVQDWRNSKSDITSGTRKYDYYVSRAGQAYLHLLAIEQGVCTPYKTDPISGKKHYDSHYKVHEVDVTDLIDEISQVLPEAKPYTVFQGRKVNVVERIHKMVNYWRRRNGIQTEWPHEEGVVFEA